MEVHLAVVLIHLIVSFLFMNVFLNSFDDRKNLMNQRITALLSTKVPTAL